MTTLQLTIPAQLDKAPRGVKIRPRDLSEWLDNLPYLDVLRAAQAAREQLRLLNRQPVAASQRLQILDAFQLSYQRLQGAVQSDKEAGGEILTQLRHLSQELAFGYKIVVNDLVNKRVPLGLKRQLGPALCGALENIGLHMTHYFTAHQAVPRALWCESVKLFHFAKQHKLDRQAIQLADGRRVSAARVFLTTALLRAADPYQLPPGTAWPLRCYLARHIEQGCLEGADDTLRTPLPLTIESRFDGCEATDTRPLQVDVSRLVELMEADIKRLRDKTAPQVPEFPDHTVTTVTQVLERLVSAWRQQRERRAERSNVHQHLEVATGLEAAWYVLNRRRPFDPETFCAPDRDNEIDLALTPGMERANRQDYDIVDCLTLDHSTGGLSLRYRASGGEHPQVGQLVALHRADTPAHSGWVIAVCRWLVEHGPGHDCELGLQYLAREARPVTLYLPAASGAGYQPAIASQQKRGERRLHTLLTHTGIYAPGRQFDLFDKGVKQTVRCAELLETAAGFERFVYTTTAEDNP